MAEFTCGYCSACPRNGCESREEASHCPNADNRAQYLDYEDRDVAAWLREHARWRDARFADVLNQAADILDNQ